MTATLIGTFTPGSAEWHAARREGVGGSEVAAILGLSPYESAFSLWHRKRGELGPVAETPYMEWGNRLESAVLGKFRDEHPELEIGTGGTWANTARPWQIANPDGLGANSTDRTRCVIEIKTAARDDDWGPAGTDLIPIHYRCQVQWYMDCLGIDTTWVAVLIRGNDYREYPIPYDPEDAHLLRGKAAAFIHSLRHDVRPDIDGSTATASAVRALPDGVTDDTAQISNQLAATYRSALTHFAHAESVKREATSLILDAIGNGKYAATPNGDRVAARTVTQDGRTHSLRQWKKKPA